MTGSIIKELRAKKKLKQEDVAEAMHITAQTYIKWESGKTEPKVSQMVKLAKTLGVSINELCEGVKTTVSEETRIKIEQTEMLNTEEKKCLNMFIEGLLLRHYSKKINLGPINS